MSRHPDLGPEDPLPLPQMVHPPCVPARSDCCGLAPHLGLDGKHRCPQCRVVVPPPPGFREKFDPLLESLRAQAQAAKGTLGMKLDGGKSRLELLPPAAIEAVGCVLGYGAKKYAPGNWKHVEDGQNRYLAASLRHVFAYLRGEELDSESGESHLAHAACSLLFVLELKDHERRPKHDP